MNIYSTYFLTNKYTNWYLAIIEKAKSENRSKKFDGTLESHHIFPKSLGGSNSKDNLVLLTCREHYICHLLLTRMVIGDPKYRMLCAYKRMSTSNRWPTKLNSKLYTAIKEEHASMAKDRYKGKPRPEHVREALIIRNTGRIVSEETRSKLRSLWKGSKRTEEDRRKISLGQTGIKFNEDRKKNLIKGRCIKFLQKFYIHYDKLTEETFNDAKNKELIKRRTCLSLASIEKYLGSIPSKEDILQFPYVEQQEE